MSGDEVDVERSSDASCIRWRSSSRLCCAISCSSTSHPATRWTSFVGQMGGADATIVDKLRATYGLDKSLPEQLVVYVGQVLHGNLGNSLFFNAPVTSLIFQRLPATLLLVLSALCAALVVGTYLRDPGCPPSQHLVLEFFNGRFGGRLCRACFLAGPDVAGSVYLDHTDCACGRNVHMWRERTRIPGRGSLISPITWFFLC